MDVLVLVLNMIGLVLQDMRVLPAEMNRLVHGGWAEHAAENPRSV